MIITTQTKKHTKKNFHMYYKWNDLRPQQCFVFVRIFTTFAKFTFFIFFILPTNNCVYNNYKISAKKPRENKQQKKGVNQPILSYSQPHHPLWPRRMCSCRSQDQGIPGHFQQAAGTVEEMSNVIIR